MTYVTGNIPLSSNFQNSTAKPLDARQVVENNIDLNDIGGFPYDGLIVHVTDTEKTYVCIDETKAKDGDGVTDPGGVIDADVWKEVGAAAAAAQVVVLPDQYPAPSGIADKSQLVSLDDATAESRPDFLYRFDEGVDVTTATDDGRLQNDGTKYNIYGSGYNVTGSAPWGNSGKFGYTQGYESRVSVGTAGAAAPFYFTSDTGDRGDFEIQFRVEPYADGQLYCLMSTDATNATTEGFYALTLNTSGGSGDMRVAFLSRHSISSAVTTYEAEWAIPGQPMSFPNATGFHLAISFMEDDRSITGNTNGTGKLRCYWDGVILEDSKTPGAYSIAAPEFNNIGRKPSTSTIWPVNLGQYLDGSGGGGTPNFYEGDMREFAVYNHRCIHNTSDKFTPPAAPTRAAALSVPNVVDSEGTASPILTTSNVGMLLPKAVEGLADGSLWNDKGAVRIAPLTGDLDESEVTSGVLSLPAGTAPAAAAGVVKVYAKNITGGVGHTLFHFDDNLNDEQGGDAAVFEAASTVGTPSYTTGASGFGKRIAVYNSAVYIYQSTHDQWIKFTAPGVGTAPFTAEFFVTMDNTDAFQALISNAGGLSQATYSSFETSFGHFSLILKAANAGGDTLELWVQPVSGSRVEVQFDPTDSARVSTGAPVHVALARTISGTDSLWHCWVDGTYMSAASGNRTTTGVANLDFEDWNLGKGFRDGLSTWSHTVMKPGYFDEFKVTKGDPVYAVGSDLTVPTGPFSVSSPVSVSKLFAMNSDGTETPLT